MKKLIAVTFAVILVLSSQVPADPDDTYSMEDFCPCEDEWENHGEYVNCVNDVAAALYESGLNAVGARSSSNCAASAKIRQTRPHRTLTSRHRTPVSFLRASGDC